MSCFVDVVFISRSGIALHIPAASPFKEFGVIFRFSKRVGSLEKMNSKCILIAASLLSFPSVASADDTAIESKPNWMGLPSPHSQLHVTVKELRGEALDGADVSLALIPNGYDTTLSQVADVAQFINAEIIPDGVYKSLRISIDDERDGAVAPHVLNIGTDNIINIAGLIRVHQGSVTAEGMVD